MIAGHEHLLNVDTQTLHDLGAIEHPISRGIGLGYLIAVMQGTIFYQPEAVNPTSHKSIYIYMYIYIYICVPYLPPRVMRYS